MAYRFLAPGFLVRDSFNNARVLASYPGPVLILHGSKDRLIPEQHGRTLADLSPRARFVSIDAGHMISLSDPAVREALDVFLDAVNRDGP